jgi:hypothetical protein
MKRVVVLLCLAAAAFASPALAQKLERINPDGLSAP